MVADGADEFLQRFNLGSHDFSAPSINKFPVRQ